MNRCQKCARTLTDRATFCPYCGATQGESSDAEVSKAEAERPTKRGMVEASTDAERIGAKTQAAKPTAVEEAPKDAKTIRKQVVMEADHFSEKGTILKQVSTEKAEEESKGTLVRTGFVGSGPQTAVPDPEPARQNHSEKNTIIERVPSELKSPQSGGGVQIQDGKPSILDDQEITDHSVGGNPDENFQSSTQAIEMTPEMLDAMERHATELREQAEGQIFVPEVEQSVDPSLAKTGHLEMTPEFMAQLEGKAQPNAPTSALGSQPEPEPEIDPSGETVIATDISSPEITPPPAATGAEVIVSSDKTPLDHLIQRFLEHKKWTIPGAIVLLIVVTILAEMLR